jgi:hypothetical protein
VLELLIFESTPSGGTYTDNAALAHHANDVGKCLGRIAVASADYITEVTGSLAIATIRNIGLPVKASGSDDLFALAIIASGTPTFTATNDLRFHFGFERD